MDNATTSGSIEESKEGSNLVIYIVWVDAVDNMEDNSDVSSALVESEHLQRLGL